MASTPARVRTRGQASAWHGLPRGYDPRCGAAPRSGEGRNRTGDTTIFRQVYLDLEHRGIACKYLIFGLNCDYPYVRKLHVLERDVGHDMLLVSQSPAGAAISSAFVDGA
jgi:hypothetical protein